MTRSILVLEDEAIVAYDLASELSDAGWTVLGPAGSIAEAVELVEEQRPDAALLDVNLSGTRSFDLAFRLREDGVSVLFLTGYATETLPDGLSDCPVLGKPVDFGSLVSIIERAVGAS